MLLKKISDSDRLVKLIIYATLAQLVEQPLCKRWVVGSTPTGGSNPSLKLRMVPPG